MIASGPSPQRSGRGPIDGSTRRVDGVRVSDRENLNIVLEENIAKLGTHRAKRRAGRSLSERFADSVTAFAGSMRSVVVHAVVVLSWTVINLGWTPFVRFDPTFVILATVASVEALFLSTFILISQNQMTREADERADLDLQITLLSEHEITRLIQLTAAIADRLGIEAAADPHLEELKRDVSPEHVVEKINQPTAK
ncbi:MAG: DUF1003 domain-containing protein [Terrimicrobiaceae bacterium]|nr:DUF1003 domain-containing protein [Terrimicrobiaceae bacterium]